MITEQEVIKEGLLKMAADLQKMLNERGEKLPESMEAKDIYSMYWKEKELVWRKEYEERKQKEEMAMSTEELIEYRKQFEAELPEENPATCVIEECNITENSGAQRVDQVNGKLAEGLMEVEQTLVTLKNTIEKEWLFIADRATQMRLQDVKQKLTELGDMVATPGTVKEEMEKRQRMKELKDKYDGR